MKECIIFMTSFGKIMSRMKMGYSFPDWWDRAVAPIVRNRMEEGMKYVISTHR